MLPQDTGEGEMMVGKFTVSWPSRSGLMSAEWVIHGGNQCCEATENKNAQQIWQKVIGGAMPGANSRLVKLVYSLGTKNYIPCCG